MSSETGHDAVAEDGTSKKPRSRKKPPGPPNLIERTNSLPLEELKSRFLNTSLTSFTTSHNDILQTYNVELYTSSLLPSEIFDSCFDLLEANMSAAYKSTPMGWHPEMKKREMKHPAMRYFILTGPPPETSESESTAPVFAGFLEFMITEEEGSESLYTYELNLLSSHQKLGLGKKLLDLAEDFGEKVGVEKSMLTVFDSNKGARRFYEREGYELDEISPEPKILRSGLIKPSTFHILSKPFKRPAKEE
ncbi:hypothetical protein ABW20_dc0107038 [Dactylellina cionopaga]|nr:hypothetical protein ABW20_dc0107038 [Dactylellina cionopaga]